MPEMFPVQKDAYGPAGSIPWKLAEVAFQAYQAAGHKSQTLERLAQRQGFGWNELVMLLRGPNHYKHGHVCGLECWCTPVSEGQLAYEREQSEA